MIDLIHMLIALFGAMAIPSFMFGFSGNKPKGIEFELMTIFTLLCFAII